MYYFNLLITLLLALITGNKTLSVPSGHFGLRYRNNKDYVRYMNAGTHIIERDAAHTKFQTIIYPTINTLELENFQVQISDSQSVTMNLKLQFEVEQVHTLCRHFNFALSSQTHGSLVNVMETKLKLAIAATIPAPFMSGARYVRNHYIQVLDTWKTNLLSNLTNVGIKVIDFEPTAIKFNTDLKFGTQALIVREGKFELAGMGEHSFMLEENYQIYEFSQQPETAVITNQEVLTLDNVSLRFSYFVRFAIEDVLVLKDMMNLTSENLGLAVNEYVHLTSQVILRDLIATKTSLELNAQRANLIAEAKQQLTEKLKNAGIRLDEVSLRDINFPKQIQDTFALQLEAQIKAQAQLESARAQVASARAQKNAAEILKSDPNIKYIMLMETLQKMSEKGRHTFNLNVSELISTEVN